MSFSLEAKSLAKKPPKKQNSTSIALEIAQHRKQTPLPFVPQAPSAEVELTAMETRDCRFQNLLVHS